MRAALVAGVLLWIIAIFVAPIALTSSTSTPLATMSAAVYGAGALVCHQKPERSFHLAGRALPVCARCTGLYTGAAFAAPLALMAGAIAIAAARARRVVLAAGLPTLITWTLEFAGLATFSNLTRFAAALPLGFAAAWLVMGIATTPSPQRLHGPRPQHKDH